MDLHRPPPSTRLFEPRLLGALIGAVCWHGVLLASGSSSRTYDAYVHIFFGDHYARDWFSTWEPRWYTGFPTISYPPGTHQLIALLSAVFGLEGAFAIVQLVAVVLLVVGVFRFTCLWFTPRAAGWAAVAVVLSSSVAQVVHVYGQLPTTMSLALLLNAQPSIRRWIHDGDRPALLAALTLLAATTACHHVTTLFGSVFFAGPVVARALLDRRRCQLDDEPPAKPTRFRPQLLGALVSRRLRRVLGPVWRCGVLGFLTILTLVVVVLPYWLWSSSDPITQVPIPHGSRADFLEDRAAGLMFFVVPWASTFLGLPYALVRGLSGRSWPLAASIGLLFLLGTGGTTPVPALLLGGAFDILTLDRFTFWATIAILPFCGQLVVALLDADATKQLRQNYGNHSPVAILSGLLCVALGSTVLAASLSQFRSLQPDPIDPEPIVEFLARDDHDRWRYLTLGFGDQMAWLSANTTALTVDGNYHSARRLPELTTRSVERLENAKFSGVPGIGSLQQFVGHPGRYHLKYVFSVDEFYDPLLWASGWNRLDRLSNGVVIWEKADVAPLPDILPSREIPEPQRLLWGLAPVTAILSAALTGVWLISGQPIPTRLRAHRYGSLGPVLKVIDRRLQRRSLALLEIEEDSDGTSRGGAAGLRQPLVSGWLWLQSWLPSPRPNRRRLAVLLCIATSGAFLLPTWVSAGREDSPEATLLAYYDRLDFADFDGAWALLDPDSRPTLEQYDIERSVRDGLLAGYSKLDSIDVRSVEIEGDLAVADVELVYLTSVSEHRVSIRHQLVWHDEGWRLIPPEIDREKPPEPFIRASEVNYLAQGRRQPTSARTAYDDVLDRPRLRLEPSRLLRDGDRLMAVGAVTNIDVDPADVTVEVVLLDGEGVRLADYAASVLTVHKVLPGESVPYRIDIEGRAGAVDLHDPVARTFRPDAFSPPILDSEIASAQVTARAVVSGTDLGRQLTAQRLEIVERDAGLVLSGELWNHGLTTATIPHVLLAFVDDDGQVEWVENAWISEAVRPRRSIDMAVEVPLPRVQRVDVPIDLFANGQDVAATVRADTSQIELPPTLPWRGLRLYVASFERTTIS